MGFFAKWNRISYFTDERRAIISTADLLDCGHRGEKLFPKSQCFRDYKQFIRKVRSLRK